MYLLDTNAISEMRKIPKGTAHPAFAEWTKHVDLRTAYTSAVCIMELQRGILGMERKDKAQGAALRHWLEQDVLPAFAGRILPIDDRTAAVCAALHIPDPAPENDAWIAAGAIQHGLTLVTRNTADFERSGVKLFNPFQAA